MDNNIIAEPLFQSIDTIVSNRIEGISFDTTILCTVVDASKANRGRYVVTNNGGITKFEAVSEKINYKKDDNVYVQIPRGDWNEQKYILYKKTTKEDEPYVYSSPLNNMIQGPVWSVETSEWGIRANSGDKKFISSNNTTSYQKFSRLGIVANFKTNLGKFYDKEHNGPYSIFNGNYGLKLNVTFKDASYATFILDCTDMNGNPYGFNGYYQQEKVFDISEFQQKTIDSLQLVFFENEDFYDDLGHKYPYEDGKTLNNIFVKDVQIVFGYDQKEFTTDTVVFAVAPEDSTYQGVTPYAYSSVEYPNLNKKAYFRWIHQLGTGDFVINPTNIEFNVYVQRKELYRAEWNLWEDTNITDGWSKYGYGHKAVSSLNQWSFSFDSAIGKSYNRLSNDNFYGQEIPLSYVHKDEVSENSVYYFSKTETYRIFIVADGKAYQSKDLILTNTAKNVVEYEEYQNQEKQAGQISKIDKVINALPSDTEYRIYCADGSSGFYYLYGQDGKIINQGVKRALQIQHHEGNDEEGNPKWVNLENVQTRWIIPKSTLTIREDDNTDLISFGLSSNNEYMEYFVNGSYLVFQLPIFLKQNSILVQCKINNNILVSIALQMNKSGIAGSSYNFILDFISNSALTDEDENAKISIIPRIFQADGTEVIFSKDQEFTWKLNSRFENISEDKTYGSSAYSLTCPDIDFPLSEYFAFLTARTKWTTKIDERGDAVESTVLETTLPIPLKKSADAAYLYGPIEIVYGLDGTTANFSNIPYQLYDKNNQLIEGIIWKMNAYAVGDFAPTIEQNIKGDFYLRPKDLYIASDCKHISVIAYKDGQIIWIQPIYITQNRYPIGAINRWDGEDIQLNADEGYILSKTIAAGSKNSNNKFSGIVLGDWSKNNTENYITKTTGIYGFNKGEMSYAFKDDGTAFIGGSSAGHIEFNGSKGLIQSAEYIENNTGIQIDLQKGTIKSKQFRLTSTGEIELGNNDKANLTYVDNNGLKTNQISFYDKNITGTKNIIGYIQQGATLVNTAQGTQDNEQGIALEVYKYNKEVNGNVTFTDDIATTLKVTRDYINMSFRESELGKNDNSYSSFSRDGYYMSFPTEDYLDKKIFMFSNKGFGIKRPDYVDAFIINGGDENTAGLKITIPGGSTYSFEATQLTVTDSAGNTAIIWSKS